MKTIDTIPAAIPLPPSGSVTFQTLRALASKASGLAAAYRGWLQRRASRRTLRDLTGDQLQDIGLTRAQAQAEVAKSFFWDEGFYPSAPVSSRSCRSPSERRRG